MMPKNPDTPKYSHNTKEKTGNKAHTTTKAVGESICIIASISLAAKLIIFPS